MQAPGQISAQYRLAGSLILLAFFSFVLQAAIFTTEHRPDEWRSLHSFLSAVTGSVGLTEEIWVRICLTFFNLGLVGGLYVCRLIDRSTLLLALVWPLTLFLFSKIYWEFFVFPLCLIRFDLPRRVECALIAAISALLWVTGEANLAVILVWRLVLLCQKSGARWIAPIGLIAVGLVLDQMMQSGAARAVPVIGDHLARFSWTREIVNPEYSVLETGAVFFASFHFFSLHDGAYWIDAVFSVVVLALLSNSPETWRLARRHAHIITAVLAVVFLFTSITHAFQNARYYFFFLPVLAAVTPRDRLLPLAVLGLLHVAVLGLSLSPQ